MAFVGMALSGSWCYPAYHAASLAGEVTTQTKVATAGLWAGLAVLFALVALVCYKALDHACSPSTKGEPAQGTRRQVLGLSLSPKDVFFASLVIFACWLPWIVLMQPVSMAADTVAQILWARGYPVWDPSTRQLLGDGYVMSDHHPVFDTLIYGLFDKIGRHVFGSDAVGYSIHGVIQAVLTAGALGTMACYLRDRLGMPRPAAIATLLFFGLVPVFGCMTQVMLKDLTSMPFFITWTLCFVEYVRLRRRGDKVGRGLIAALVVLGVLCALTRKTLLYIELGALVIALIALPGRKALVLPVLVPVLVMQVLLARILFPALGVAPGGTQEAIGVPLQQTAYTYIVHGSSMSEEDRAVIGEVLDLDAIASNYDETDVDHVKDRCFRHDCTRAEVISYLLVWARQAFVYPDSYIGAENYLSALFTPGLVDSEGFFTRTGWPEYGGNDILPEYPAFSYDQAPSATPGQTTCMQIVFGTLPTLPVVGLVVSCVLYNLWIPMLALLSCILKKAKGPALALMPLLLSLLVIAMCPAAQARYGFNLLYCAPLVLLLPFSGAAFQARGEEGGDSVTAE